MTDAPRWAAVVVNYESGALITECVEALRADDSAGPVEVVVVDNGSTDGSVADLRQRCPGVTVMEPHANLGYARGAYALGYVDDLRDPLDVLMGRAGTSPSFAPTISSAG